MTRSLTVLVENTNCPIKESPGFEKKELSEYKLDILGLCEFGCVYCSSNHGNYLRIRREPFADRTEEQLGERIYPDQEPRLTFHFERGLDELEKQLARRKPTWGTGRTLVFSMLTDGFSPQMVQTGMTMAALELILEKTSFRIRVLTKNAVVGKRAWVDFFAAHPGRFVVGLSTGTLDDRWAKAIEIGASTPTARLRALRNLQDAGVPTFGMLCPVFPDVLEGEQLEKLVDMVRPDLVEHVWAEPYNNRTNWAAVRDGYRPTSHGYRWFEQVYGQGDLALWSRYATELYTRLRDKAAQEGWLHKLQYLLYEQHIAAADAPAFAGLKGVLLQSKPAADGRSQNRAMAALQ